MSAPNKTKMPAVFIPHGGGPCFFMEWTWGPRDTWDRMRDFLAGYRHQLPAEPKAIVVVSAHWEEPDVTVNTGAAPPLEFDYYGFPDHTYQLQYAAPGSPELAERIAGLLSKAGMRVRDDSARGWDHGVFIPLKVMFPEETIPVVQLSLKAGLRPDEHLSIGRALALLRDEGVLIVGSGMSYHNMRGFGRQDALGHSEQFDAWLTQAVEADAAGRENALCNWAAAPAGRLTHPREEHLLPLMVVAGTASQDPGRKIFSDVVMGVRVSAFEFPG